MNGKQSKRIRQEVYLNASKNILKQGLKIISGCGAQSENKQKPGEASGT
jgi:hypothetical protein